MEFKEITDHYKSLIRKVKAGNGRRRGIVTAELAKLETLKDEPIYPDEPVTKKKFTEYRNLNIKRRVFAH